jgi:hypothetical protein
MDIRTVLLELHRAFAGAGIPHAVIGALAMAPHGAGRATATLDFIADGERADDVDRLLRAHGYDCLHRAEFAANYASADPVRGRVDFLLARRQRGPEILARAREHPVLETRVRVVDAEDLIGLKVQGFSNDPSRRHIDLADIQRLLRFAPALDLARVREYFRLFDREKELDALLAMERER